MPSVIERVEIDKRRKYFPFPSLPLPPLFLQERCMFLHLAFCGILHKHVFRSLIMRRVLCGTLWFDHYCSFWSANPVSDQKNKSASRPRTDNSKWMPNCWYSQKEKCLRDIASRIYAHWHNHRHHHHDHHHELKRRKWGGFAMPSILKAWITVADVQGFWPVNCPEHLLHGCHGTNKE